MKLSSILLFFVIFNVAAEGLAQSKKLNIKMEKTSLKSLFKQLKLRSDVSFVYSEKQIADVMVQAAEFTDATVEEILEVCLQETDLDFSFENNVVVIRPREKEVKYEVIEHVVQQTVKITGTVKDMKGKPIPFANIVLKGTTIGVVADMEGKFTLEFTDEENPMFVISSIGYKSIEIPQAGRSLINIVLEEDLVGLEEVVVTGYQTISKERSTGSFKKVVSEDITRTSNANMANTLEGMAPGLLVSNTNNGDDLKITIRGVSTLEANSNPLVVVDGFPIEGSLSTINSNDIESITILQDAAAASIYGVKAANGVIVVKTKTGTEEKPIIEFASNYTVKKSPSISYLNLMDSRTAVDLELDYYEAGHIDPTSYDKYNSSTQVIDLIRKGITDRNSPAFDKLRKQNALQQYDDNILRNGIEKDYSISIRGNKKGHSYLASAKVFDNQSVWKGDDFNRINLNLSNKIKLNEKLNVDLGISSYINKQNYNSPRLGPILDSYNGWYSVAGLRPYDLLLDESGNRIPLNYGYNQSEKERLIALGYPYNWDYNLIDELESQFMQTKAFENRFRAGIDYNIMDGLNFSSKFQYERREFKRIKDYSEETYFTRNRINETTLIDDDGVLNVQLPKGGIYNLYKTTSESMNFRAQMDYDRVFGAHRITALAGTEVQKMSLTGSNIQKYGYNPRTLTTSSSIAWGEKFEKINGDKYRINSADRLYETEDRFISVYGNFAYTLLEKYSLTGSVRQDQSNLFGVDAEFRKNPLWSIGAGWNLSKETFMDLDWVNKLKLRISYGFNGNIDPASSGYMVEQLSNNTDLYFRSQYGYISDPGNPMLRWERTEITNLGIDFSIFNHRLSGSIEYYDKHSKDLFIDASINSTYGFTTQRRNDGEISNKGVDVSLNASIINAEAFNWSAGLNFSLNKNEVLSTNTSADAISNYIKDYWQPIEGKPLGRLYAYKWAGLSENGDPQIYNAEGEIIDHLTEITNPDALVYMGSTDPKYYGSFVSNFSYKGLKLTAMFTFKAGHVYRRPTANYSSSIFAWGDKEIENRWKQKGDENQTDVPGIKRYGNGSTSTRDWYYANADINVEDASYIRFKELSLTYKLPEKLLSQTFLKDVRLKFNVQNLGLVWTASDTDYDPDYIPYRVLGSYSTSSPWYGKHQGLAPQMSFTCGVNVVF